MSAIAAHNAEQQKEIKRLRNQLASLRVSVAQFACANGVTETEHFKLDELNYDQLHELASSKDNGWHTLLIRTWKKVSPQTF